MQNLAEFHAALRKRDALYDAQHREMADNPQDYENLHPKDFFNQFHRRADDEDKNVVSEAPYRIRQQLRDALAPERDAALDRTKETYKRLFIDNQLAKLDQDRQYYLGKIADAANDQDRERYLTALIGRLKLSGDVGLLYKEDAERLIENIPSDLDIFSFNRAFADDPARAQRLLLYGAYPNIRPELREELVRAAKSAATPLSSDASKPAAGDSSEAPGRPKITILKRIKMRLRRLTIRTQPRQSDPTRKQPIRTRPMKLLPARNTRRRPGRSDLSLNLSRCRHLRR